MNLEFIVVMSMATLLVAAVVYNTIKYGISSSL